MKQRIWELDAFRGLCVLGMVVVHFVYDLVDLYGIIDWEYPDWFSFVKNWGGVLFLLISGISATLGSRSVRRGILVFCCGMIVTAVTYGMFRFGFAGKGIIIYFGVLQCLGTCMLLWPIFKKLPWWALASIGIAFVALGFWMAAQPGVDVKYLMPLGLPWKYFYSSDYFPLFPNLGYFLLGAAIGRTAYRGKQTLLPQVNAGHAALRFLQFCGKHSLLIYLLHQPILSGISMILSMLI